MHEATVRDLDLGHAEPRSSARSEGHVRLVVAITFVTMFAEIAAGLASRSKALEADGWHMGTHAGAIGLAALAYAFARSRADDARFTFGAGKVHALAAWTNAIVLLSAALWMVGASVWRLFVPVEVQVFEALPIAVIGLLVNVASAWLLKPEDVPAAMTGHNHDHDHGHSHNHPAPRGEHDLNRKGAYLHVLRDLATSVCAKRNRGLTEVGLHCARPWDWIPWTALTQPTRCFRTSRSNSSGMSSSLTRSIGVAK